MQIIKPQKSSKTYKDCTLKGLILRSIKAGHNEARDIFTNINYRKSLDALYAEMCRLSNYGYVSTIKEQGISRYALTKKGLEHADDPYICVKKKEEWLKNIVNKNVMAILRDNDAVKRLAYDMALNMPSSGGITEIVRPESSHSNIINSPAHNQPEDPYAAAYHPGIKPIVVQNVLKDEYGNPITFDEAIKHKANKKERAAQIRLRKKIAEEYFQKKHIYGGFFTRWGGDYKLVKLTGGMQDIISTSNREFRRMHVIETLVANTEAKLHIVKIDKHGIYISGEGLSNKFLRF